MWVCSRVDETFSPGREKKRENSRSWLTSGGNVCHYIWACMHLASSVITRPICMCPMHLISDMSFSSWFDRRGRYIFHMDSFLQNRLKVWIPKNSVKWTSFLVSLWRVTFAYVKESRSLEHVSLTNTAYHIIRDLHEIKLTLSKPANNYVAPSKVTSHLYS